jgi:hypothetical protein
MPYKSAHIAFFFCTAATLKTLNSETDNVNNKVPLRGFRANVGVVESNNYYVF